jgi:hypothetical protein
MNGAVALRCASAFLLAVTVMSAGCVTPSAPTATVQKVSCNVPTITPQPETKQSQNKGGLEISVAPVHYDVARRESVTVRQVPPPPIILTPQRSSSVYVERTTKPNVGVNPDRLKFIVKVNNKMPRVFYGAGTIVQFNVGGRLQGVDQAGYGNFLGAIVPPRQELQLEILGPSVSTLGESKGVIGVFLYDVVTKQDETGKVTEKQNFEWYFDYTIQPRQMEASASTEKLWMPVADYQEAMVRQSMERMQQNQPTQGYQPAGYPVYPQPRAQ